MATKYGIDEQAEESFYPEPPLESLGGVALVFLLGVVGFMMAVGVLVWNLWKWGD